MKLDRSQRSKLFAVALAALIPAGAAYATDIYDSLKTLGIQPDRDSRNARARAQVRDTSAPSSTWNSEDAANRGAQGPYRSDMDTDRPAVSSEPPTYNQPQPQFTPTPSYNTPAPSIPTINERSP